MNSDITNSSLATDGLCNFNLRKNLKRRRRRNKAKTTNLKKKKLKKFYYQNKTSSAKLNISKFETQDSGKPSMMSNWYWSNYRKAVQWQEKHKVAHWKSCALALMEENRYLLQIINQLRPDMHHQISDTCSNLNATFCRNQNYQFSGQLHKSRNLYDWSHVGNAAEVNNHNDDDDNDDDEQEENDNDDENDDELEFEMSEEMVEFFRQSYLHKMELKKMKEKELLNKAEDEIQQLQTNKIKRSDEMKLLYGDGASMITGMETAVQLSFEKYCDTKSPKYWPNIPFRL